MDDLGHISQQTQIGSNPRTVRRREAMMRLTAVESFPTSSKKVTDLLQLSFDSSPAVAVKAATALVRTVKESSSSLDAERLIELLVRQSIIGVRVRYHEALCVLRMHISEVQMASICRAVTVERSPDVLQAYFHFLDAWVKDHEYAPWCAVELIGGIVERIAKAQAWEIGIARHLIRTFRIVSEKQRPDRCRQIGMWVRLLLCKLDLRKADPGKYEIRCLLTQLSQVDAALIPLVIREDCVQYQADWEDNFYVVIYSTEDENLLQEIEQSAWCTSLLRNMIQRKRQRIHGILP